MIAPQKTNRKQQYSQNISICDQLNLNIDKLRVQQLMANTTYRRLYNIVRNDMSRSQLSFRKNLIKELYFLLQITPVIKQELKEHFLGEVEKWYNLNDHKKIDLASNKLNKLLNIVHHSKKESTVSGGIQRPKSGVVWNQNVSPFLRPYTATRERNDSKGKLRPQSSKYGNQSTKVETTDEICIRDFTTNIQQELQISQDFLQKHRTNHPDYQPTYEQLYNILKRVQTCTAEIQTPKKDAKSRNIKSAVPYNQRVITLIRQQGNHQSQNLIPDQVQLQNEQGQRQSSQSSDQQVIYSSNKKEYKAFSREIKIVEKEAVKEHEPDNLDKYSHCIQNKLVQALREDREMAGKYVNYTKQKTTMRTEMNRKLESKRLFSAKHVTSKRSQFSMKEPIKSEQKQNDSFDFFDLTKDPLNIQQNKINSHPTYNKRQVLNNLYQAPVKLFKKLNSPITPKQQPSETLKRPLTACVRFNSATKFDPLSTDNVKQHNSQVLQEIEKIKMRMGGKCSASTDSLMKALYIDAYDDEPIGKWETLNPYFGMISIGKQKKLKKKGRKLKSKAK